MDKAFIRKQVEEKVIELGYLDLPVETFEGRVRDVASSHSPCLIDCYTEGETPHDIFSLHVIPYTHALWTDALLTTTFNKGVVPYGVLNG